MNSEIPIKTGDLFPEISILPPGCLILWAELVLNQFILDSSEPIYDLFFATNHQLGFLKMKEAMRKVDPKGTFSFSDANDPNQMTLFSEENSKKVAELLLLEFSNKGKVTGEQVTEFVRYSTFYLDRDKTNALRWLEKNKLIIVDPVKLDKVTKRKKTYFPPDSMIRFL